MGTGNREPVSPRASARRAVPLRARAPRALGRPTTTPSRAHLCACRSASRAEREPRRTRAHRAARPPAPRSRPTRSTPPSSVEHPESLLNVPEQRVAARRARKVDWRAPRAAADLHGTHAANRRWASAERPRRLVGDSQLAGPTPPPSTRHPPSSPGTRLHATRRRSACAWRKIPRLSADCGLAWPARSYNTLQPTPRRSSTRARSTSRRIPFADDPRTSVPAVPSGAFGGCKGPRPRSSWAKTPLSVRLPPR